MTFASVLVTRHLV